MSDSAHPEAPVTHHAVPDTPTDYDLDRPTEADATCTCSITPGADDPCELAQTEWLLVDGLGGYAMGTALGLNTRRYHGWLISATHPPLARIMGLNTCLERITIRPDTPDEASCEISTFEFEPRVLSPRGYQYLVKFEKALDECRWTYRIDDMTIVRTLRLPWRTGGCEIRYSIHNICDSLHDSPIRLRIHPMIRLGSQHQLARQGRRTYQLSGTSEGICVTADEHGLELSTDLGTFQPDPDNWLNFYYHEEKLRGQDCLEDLYCPGYFDIMFPPGRADRIVRMSARLRPATAAPSAIPTRPNNTEPSRRAHLALISGAMASRLPLLAGDRMLLSAADDFVVPRHVGGERLMTVLAGYPWFTDWGRDTMISLPGLLLTTRRFPEALATLRAFAAHRWHGLIPNRFDDEADGAAHYNTIDAALWFCHAACEYLRESGDRAGFARDLAPACVDVLHHYYEGTDFGIAADPADGLISAGNVETQLTWMDARRDGVTFTPRHGKAVEINALWYHDLISVAEAIRPSDAASARNLTEIADRVGASFGPTFWCDETQCLADCVIPSDPQRSGAVSDGRREVSRWIQDRSIRPNQIFALSLRHSPLSKEQQRSVLRVVERELLTPVGLRTLSPADSRYRPTFEGDMFNRDGAYHQGTVWPWLMGPFVEALLRVDSFSDEARRRARQLLDGLRAQMSPPAARCLGQLCEVYDGDDSPERPRAAGGCPAQAWSVAELLRCLALTERGRD